VGVAKPLPPAHSSIRYLCAPYAKYSLRQTSMQTVGRSPDISVMWRTEYYAGAGYIRHVAVKRLRGKSMHRHTGHSDVSCAKTAKPIEMQFGLLNQVDPRKNVLDPDPHAKGQF